MNKNKVKRFIKEHELEIAGFGAAAVGIIVGCVVTGYYVRKDINYTLCSDRKFNLLQELMKARQKSNYYAWNNGLEKYTLADLGKAGEDLIRVSDGVLKPCDVTTGILLYVK